MQVFRTMAGEAGVSVTVSVASDAPASIDVDPVRLREVLTNLLANAVRHTPRGGRVTVAVTHAAGSAVGSRVAFEVEDDGPGIAADRLASVFERFVSSADTGGTGLGLAIAKRLVEAHGGTIHASVPPGGGTRMRFEVPSA